MKTILAKILVASFSIAAFTAFAGDTIEGAFGLRLGDVFDPSSAIGASNAPNGAVWYQFKRDQHAFPGFRGFDTCYVMLTPSTHKIYRILGVGVVVSREAGLAQQSVLMGILKAKFSDQLVLTNLFTTGEVQSIDQGARHVVSRVSTAAGGRIELEFLDGDLQTVADAERRK